MPDGYSNAEQPQQCYVKRPDDVREQAGRLHGKRQLIALEKTDDDAGEERTRRRHGNVAGSSDRPTRRPSMRFDRKSKRHPERKKYETLTASLSITNRRLAPVLSAPTDLTFYPVYCHKASPTYFQWVKLTAHDIHHTLHHREGYLHSWITEQICSHNRDAPQLLFYNNHPIQFIQVIGVVVSAEVYFEKFWLFTIDDSSGATIDVVCRKPDKNTMPAQECENGVSEDEKEEAAEIQKLSDQVAAVVDVGMILQVKGTITLFQRSKQVDHSATILGYSNNAKQYPASRQEMPTRQISLQRLTVVHDTNKEISLIAARTRFYDSVLNQPWSLTKQERARLHRQALGEVEHKRRKVRKQAENKRKVEDEQARDAKKILQQYAEEERVREQEAEKAGAAGEALRKSNMRHQAPVKGILRSATTATEVTNPLTKESVNAKAKRGEKRKKRRSAIEIMGVQTSTSASPPKFHHNEADTSLSFAADDGERSALLRAAFR